MDSLFLIFLIFISIYIFQSSNVTEGYTNCIRKIPIKLYSFHYQQQWNELSHLPNIDLANRAYRVNIPLSVINENIRKNKSKLILLVINNENRLFKPTEGKPPQEKPTEENASKNKYSINNRFISGYKQSNLPYSDF
jgi:hypothetical protein